MIGKRVDLGVVAPVDELDQRIARDLVGEPGAAGAEDAAFPIEVDEVGDRDRLFEMPLLLDEARLARARRRWCDPGAGTPLPDRRPGSPGDG